MSHLNSSQRYAICILKKENKTQTEIAEAINVHKSTISRELYRNSDKRSGEYRDELAERKANARKKEKPKVIHLTESKKETINSLLLDHYSPEQIVGSLRKAGKETVSTETIYRYIWADKKANGTLHKNLRHQGRKYAKRGSAKGSRGLIVGRVDISDRPAIVEKKERLGDLEIDLMIGKNHKCALLTINDRATSQVVIRKLSSKDAEALAINTIAALLPFKDQLFTITSDNGKEFASHQTIATVLGISWYFAKPYHSWERGANENTNGLIRQYFPKGSEFESITDAQVQWVQDKLNNRPRKRLEFDTPNERYLKLINGISTA